MRQALERALEAIEAACKRIDELKAENKTLKEALAQPEQTNTRPYYTIDELNAWADEKEKQAWRNAAIRIGEELSSVGPDGYYDMDAWKWLDWAMEQEPRGKNSLAQPERDYERGFIDGMQKQMQSSVDKAVNRMAQPEQKPVKMVAYNCTCGRTMKFESVHGVVAPQRTWIGLMDEEILAVNMSTVTKLIDEPIVCDTDHNIIQLGKAIEAKLKDKNA